MKRKLICLLAAALALVMAGCSGMDAEDLLDIADAVLDGADVGMIGGEDGPTVTQIVLPPDEEEKPEEVSETAGGAEEELYEEALDEDGTYNSAEDVALYLHLYDHLPENYITKSEARDLGWTGGSVERYAPGCAIGGDRFGNREGLLPEEAGRTYYECDVDTIGESSRGARRLIFSNDGLIYYTEDHYESFTLLYGEE